MNDTRQRVLVAAPWVVAFAAMCVLPFALDEYWIGTVITSWMPLAAAVLGLNLLTGFNGQISVGHGAFYGLGAYSAAVMITELEAPFLVAIVGAAVVCFVAGVLVGLPALRIKGLYLALVTLAVGALFPSLIGRFSYFLEGKLTSPRLVYGKLKPQPIQFLAPEWSGLTSWQWVYFCFLAVISICFLLVRNLIRSRVGRSMIAIRDNEVAAEVSGIHVARIKVLTFGVSAALAGVGGSLLALHVKQVVPSNFDLSISLYLTVMMVVGGAASISGPLVGVVVYGLFRDKVTPELGKSLEPIVPLGFGISLITLMFTAPDGLVGLARRIGAKLRSNRTNAAGPLDAADPLSTPDPLSPVPDTISIDHNSQEDP